MRHQGDGGGDGGPETGGSWLAGPATSPTAITRTTAQLLGNCCGVLAENLSSSDVCQVPSRTLTLYKHGLQ